MVGLFVHQTVHRLQTEGARERGTRDPSVSSDMGPDGGGSRVGEEKDRISQGIICCRIVNRPHLPEVMSATTNRTYPTLPAEVERRLEAIKTISKDDPGFFDDPRCPYPWLREYVGQRKMPVGVGGGDSERGSPDFALEDLQLMIEDMNSFGHELQSAEPNERIQFFKAKTALYDKWTSLKSRLYDLKFMADFQKIVISTMEEVLTKDQQQDFKNKLKAISRE